MKPLPQTMKNLPLTKTGLPVPYVAAWSSEHWAVARTEPLVGGRMALFSAGRMGRGRPLLGVMNEERQRRVSVLGLYQVCARPYGDDGWVAAVNPSEKATDQGPMVMTHEPPACGPCMQWAITVCPGLRNGAGRLVDTGSVMLLRSSLFSKAAQLIDPSESPPNYHHLFDHADDVANRERLGRIARRSGGLVACVAWCFPIGTRVNPEGEGGELLIPLTSEDE